jgi:hypothetical protein
MSDRGHRAERKIREGSENTPCGWLDQGQMQVIVTEKQIGKTLLGIANSIYRTHVGENMNKQFPTALHLCRRSFVQLLGQRPEADCYCAASHYQAEQGAGKCDPQRQRNAGR